MAAWKRKHRDAAPRLATSCATDVGRVRSNNEDSVRVGSINRNGQADLVLCVADGVGGGPAGEVASRTAVDAVFEVLESSDGVRLADSLQSAFAIADERVAIIAERKAATTLVVAVVDPDASVTVASVGDSRAYLVAKGRAHQITQDHSLVAARVAAGVITAAQARVSPDRNVVLRAIGSAGSLPADVFQLGPLRKGERLVLCTDGVHGLLDDHKIARLTKGPLEACAAALVAAAVEAGGTDNATAAVAGLVPHEGQPTGRLSKFLGRPASPP